MASLRRLASYYLNYPDGFSVLRDVHGYDEPPRTLSLRERLRYLESFADLRVMLIQRWIDDWNENGIGPNGETIRETSGDLHMRSFRRIAAVLMALKDIGHFDEPYTIAWAEAGETGRRPLKEAPPADDESVDNDDPRRDFFPRQVERWVENHFEVVGFMGSSEEWWKGKDDKPNGSYDFVMKEIVALLYVFRDEPDLLTDEACYRLIERGFKPFLAEEFGKHLTYTIPVPWWATAVLGALIFGAAAAAAAGLLPGLIAAVIAAAGLTATVTFLVVLIRGLTFPETENHVLLAYSSIYLARQWVKRNPRIDLRFGLPPYSNIHNDGLDDPIEDLLLQAAGRVLHNGFFECSGRPYRAFSVHPLMCIRSFADPERLRTAAGNALDFAWANSAFRSYHQRMYSPFRRNNERADDVSIYDTGSVVMVAPFFTPPRPKDPVLGDAFWDGQMGNGSGFTLWAMLLDYRPHEVITDFAIKENLFAAKNGYWARMQARYTDAHYVRGKRPRYFESDGRPFGASSEIRSTPEVCFHQPGFMNGGGGRFDRYEIDYDGVLAAFEGGPKGTHEYDFIARPQVAFVEKAFQELASQDMKDNVMFMLGGDPHRWNRQPRFWLADNSGIYKGFSYGYRKGRRSDDRHLDFPMSVPESWSAFRYEEGGKHGFQNSVGSRVAFTFYALKVGEEQEPGPYVVTARVSKSHHSRKYRSYARGFWELVPRERFDSVEDLKDWVLQHNPDEQFSDSTDGEQRFYIYTMTTGESLQLNDLLGHGTGMNPIRNIWASGKTPLIDEPLKLSEFVVNHNDSSDVKAMPLLEVREADLRSEFTKRFYAIAHGDGRLRISNPYMNFELIIDSSNYKSPSKSSAILSQ